MKIRQDTAPSWCRLDYADPLCSFLFATSRLSTGIWVLLECLVITMSLPISIKSLAMWVLVQEHDPNSQAISGSCCRSSPLRLLHGRNFFRSSVWSSSIEDQYHPGLCWSASWRQGDASSWQGRQEHGIHRSLPRHVWDWWPSDHRLREIISLHRKGQN